ncbi:hypothetical protein HAZT_HAZT004323 [Hyalella azteca]|uniref:Uncharacterized protein n=1 Tax=Hyalella azteca TaxID=294128 RepID=A0A6A0GRA4_HYAAZ|nr:hypothetical protein HAZT_HAZT004323 [Hyalella azteca]
MLLDRHRPTDEINDVVLDHAVPRILSAGSSSSNSRFLESCLLVLRYDHAVPRTLSAGSSSSNSCFLESCLLVLRYDHVIPRILSACSPSQSTDKLDGSFSRSRSSSISSLENISSEAIQCLTFADSYVKKNDAQMLPTLWVGTSLGSVIQVIVSIPSAETRLTNPVSVFPSGTTLPVVPSCRYHIAGGAILQVPHYQCCHLAGTIFRLKGSILAMCFLDASGALIRSSFESWRDAQRDKRDRTPTKSTSTPTCGSSGGSGTPNNRLSPTNSGGGGSTEQHLVSPTERQFIVFCSEKVARVVELPSQSCVYKQIITEVSFVVKAEIIQMKDAVCLVCYIATGHIAIFNLPSLRQLTYVDFLPLVDLR